MLKKIMLLMLLVASTQSFAFSFDKVNLNGGLNFATVEGKGDFDLDPELGLEIGAEGAKKLSIDSSVSVGLYYVVKKAEKTISGQKAELDSSWIEIPVLYNHNFNKVDVYAGPYVSFNINDKVDDTDYGIKLGGAYSITESGSVYADYSIGLAELDKEETKISTISFGYSHTL